MQHLRKVENHTRQEIVCYIWYWSRVLKELIIAFAEKKKLPFLKLILVSFK